MSLPSPPREYDQGDQQRTRAQLGRWDLQNRKKGQDLEIAGSERLIAASPNGARWVIQVADDGSISAVAL